MDNLNNATEEALKRVKELTGKSAEFVKLDLLDPAGMDKLFTFTKFDAVIHLWVRCLGPGRIELKLLPSRLFFQPLLEALIDDSLGIR